jgi:hypothetical protein
MTLNFMKLFHSFALLIVAAAFKAAALGNPVDHTSKAPRYSFTDSLVEQERQLKENPLLQRFRELRRKQQNDPHTPRYHFSSPGKLIATLFFAIACTTAPAAEIGKANPSEEDGVLVLENTLLRVAVSPIGARGELARQSAAARGREEPALCWWIESGPLRPDAESRRNERPL